MDLDSQSWSVGRGGGWVKGDSGSVAYVLRLHQAEDMDVVVRQEGAGYTDQYGWDGTFEALVARIVDEFVRNFDPLRDC